MLKTLSVLSLLERPAVRYERSMYNSERIQTQLFSPCLLSTVTLNTASIPSGTFQRHNANFLQFLAYSKST